ncbi:putative 5-3 exonuclease XRNA [Trypanosoma grayi]|uniref:putative 5-3 exonuclease XRNA n=1 Tax=Trypanosoma grayi TaxID=71804 RepID=UPI0004F44216|nr:putative 5-3 exonuclease XRNA [Trypanosoma grayi]KEG09197.1 putative 5-3 exonuclease XRNA [Trypanosoma grayi]
MGIAGFYLWLKRWYGECVEDVPESVVEAAQNGQALPDENGARRQYDNLYLDMNGLIHPCCHDTAPLPEPQSEEEMLQRIFAQMDLLFKIVRPRKCLVLCIDGVAPQSKMNQQRSRRFRAAEERVESDTLSEKCAEAVIQQGLPRPNTRDRWDHNVITPSTAFMERVGLAIEWFVVKKLNEDPAWRHITVVFSDAHVPGEGEHKIMQYIRGLRAQPGYDPRTSHVVHGMDADLICLGLSTHEEHLTILRNQLTETFQPDHNRFCYFSLRKYRQRLKEDFSSIGKMNFERVLDDFVFLCFFVGNDFLPHVPLISIKTKGIELLLDHYVRSFAKHSYITDKGEVNYPTLSKFLKSFIEDYMGSLKREYGGVLRAKERAKTNVEERVKGYENELKELLASVEPNCSNAQEVSDAAHKLMLSILKERTRLVADKQPLGFSYVDAGHRDIYYEKKFGWDPAQREEFEANIKACCAEYLRGTQWVMRYYTIGCPSWDWFYPFHYAPLLQDLAQFNDPVNVEMHMGAPRNPVVQLLAVLPRLSVHALPEELHEAVEDPTSVLGIFYPDRIDVDFSEAHFSYQGVLRLPFINSQQLQAACQEIVQLEPDQGVTLLLCHESNPLCCALNELLAGKDSTKAAVRIPRTVTAKVPIAGCVGRYKMEWPLHAKLECPDAGVAKETSYGDPIEGNKACCYRYELDTRAVYKPRLLRTSRKHTDDTTAAAEVAATAAGVVEAKDTAAVKRSARKRTRETAVAKASNGITTPTRRVKHEHEECERSRPQQQKHPETKKSKKDGAVVKAKVAVEVAPPAKKPQSEAIPKKKKNGGNSASKKATNNVAGTKRRLKKKADGLARP